MLFMMLVFLMLPTATQAMLSKKEEAQQRLQRQLVNKQNEHSRNIKEASEKYAAMERQTSTNMVTDDDLLYAHRHGGKVKHFSMVMRGNIIHVIDDEVTALHGASIAGNCNLVKLLLNEGSLIDEKSLKQKTALHYACELGYIDIARLLIDNEFNVNAETDNKYTPLMLALELGDQKMVELLVDHGAMINTKDLSGQTPLHKACISGNKVCVRFLLDNKADLYAEDRFGNMPIDKVLEFRHIALLETLKLFGCTLVKSQEKKKITRQQNELNNQLFIACKKGCIEEVELAIKNGANIEAKDPLMGATALHMACYFKFVDVVRLLLKKEAKVNAQCDTGETALHFACEQNLLDIIRLLLSYEADMDIRTLSGTSPLHFACQNNHINAVEILLKNGANINAECSNQGKRPLHISCAAGALKVVKYLIGKKADINALTRGKFTPLAYAVIYGQRDVLKYLLDQGANTDIKDGNDRTALQLSYYQKDSFITQLLRKAGAHEITDEQAKQEGQEFFADLKEHEPAVSADISTKEVASLVESHEDKNDLTTAATTKDLLKIAKPISKKTVPKVKYSWQPQKSFGQNESTTKKESNSITKSLVNHYVVLQDINFRWPKFLTEKEQNTIKSRLLALKTWPDIENVDIKPLKGTKKITYRLRVGDIRIIFFTDDTNKQIFIKEIGTRKNIYKKR